MSAREELVERLIDKLRSKGMNMDAPYGILTSLSGDKKYRSITFGKARTMDAELRVYGPKFIMLKVRGPYERHFGAQSVFQSEAELMERLEEVFAINCTDA